MKTLNQKSFNESRVATLSRFEVHNRAWRLVLRRSNVSIKELFADLVALIILP